MEVVMQQRKKFGIYGEKLAIALIVLGFIMMIQPLTIILYTYGFSTILAGVILFNIVSHF